MSNVDTKNCLQDLASVYSASPDSLIEVSFAAPGDSNFRSAVYLDSVTAAELENFSSCNQSVAVLSLDRQAFLTEFPSRKLGELGPRNGSNRHVLQRNLVVVEFDGKDLRSDWSTLSREAKSNLLNDWANDLTPNFKAKGLEPYLVVMSGNGLHFYLRVKRAVDCSDAAQYRSCYKYLLEYIKWNITDGRVEFDDNCANSGRAIRLPGSVNHKVKDEPIQTEILYWNQESFSDFALAQIWENALAAIEQEKEQVKIEVAAAKGAPHLEKLRAALSFIEVAQRFGYSKVASVKALSTADEYVMSSPWTEDKHPSFCFNEKKKVFVDWSGKQRGNIFTFIALMAGLNVKTQFKKVVKIAEEITSITCSAGTSNKSGDDDEVAAEKDGYAIENGCHVWRHQVQGNLIATKLSNFAAQIIAEEVHDDGLVQNLFQRIRAVHEDGTLFPELMVRATEFASLSWVSSFGSRAIVSAGQGLKDRLRQAIQENSKGVERKTVYAHVGWRELDGQMKFLHAGGAIGPNGNDDSISVRLGTNRISDYKLPAPPVNDELRQAVRASLGLMALDNRGIGTTLLAATYFAPLSNILSGDFCVFISGQTGTFKSCLTALSQAHFGSRFNDRHLPGNWSSTDNALERMAFVANSSVFVVDDFNPRGTLNEVAQYHKKADRLIRAAGNQQGRDRMDANTDFKVQYYPRCLLFSSGEDIPKGHSLRVRLFLLELKPGHITRTGLTPLQAHAGQGHFAESMSGYVQWLAGKYESLKDELAAARLELREKIQKDGEHRRNVDTLAKLILGLKVFLKYAVDANAITEEEAQEYFKNGKKALFEQSQRQNEVQANEDPVDRFFDLLRSALVAKKIHLADATTGEEPADATRYGWKPFGDKVMMHGSDDLVNDKWVPSGEKIGWVGAKEICLDPNLTFTTISKILRDQNDALPVTQQTLWKRLKERGLLIAEEQHSTLKRNIEGLRRRVLVFENATLFPDFDGNDDSKKSAPRVPHLESQETQNRGAENTNKYQRLDGKAPDAPPSPLLHKSHPLGRENSEETLHLDMGVQNDLSHLSPRTPTSSSTGAPGALGALEKNHININKIERKIAPHLEKSNGACGAQLPAIEPPAGFYDYPEFPETFFV